jgi:asparagine synthase (glutamine-hydrolysing)
MCGISGFITIEKKLQADSIFRMNSTITHRGPDDEGVVLFDENDFCVLGSSDTAEKSWNSVEVYSPQKSTEFSSFTSNVGFGHRRLSILDLSSKGHQPFCTRDAKFWITFNGEVYNYLEIRNELIELGYFFSTDTDTEVILYAYQEWGIECQHRFNGMWAFAIYDRQEKTLFLSRDRFGIKPLYYWFSPDGDFYFASEIKQFTVLPGWTAVLNKERGVDFLFYALTDHSEETLFKGVKTLLPSHFILTTIESLLVNSSTLICQNWYSIKITNSTVSFEEAKVDFLEKFKNSVNLHLRSDVTVGSSLSGGLDSSSIVQIVNLLLRQQNKSKLQKTFSSCSEDQRFDERFWMEEVVKDTEVDAHYVYPKGEDVFKLTDKLIWHVEEPYQSQSVFLGYHVYEMARRSNVKVLLSGQGADEYLSGYNSFRNFRLKTLAKRFKLRQLYSEIGSVSKIIKILLNIAFDKLPSMLRYKLSFFNKKNRLLSKIVNLNILDNERIHPYKYLKHNDNSYRSISNHQLFKEPLQKYLKWEDRISMLHSIEARVPFLEYQLIEFVYSLPLDYLDAPGQSKKILVEALKGILTEKVRIRKDKQGFTTPERRWFITDFSADFLKVFDEDISYAKGIINAKEARAYLVKMQKGDIPFDYSYWHIILFCKWMKIFDVSLD